MAAVANSHLPICVTRPNAKINNLFKKEAMLYKPHTPMELGDAALGQLTSILVFVFDHMIPAVHNVISWETTDYSPIVPEWAGDAKPINKTIAQPRPQTA